MQELICILDCSGSMQAVRNEALNGFNNFLKEQKEIGEANLTIIWFDNNWKVGYEGKLSEAQEIDSWPAGGMTALNDAIGKTFNHVKDRFSKEKPEKVIMAIQTDGYENASTEFQQQTVANMIKEHEDKYAWDVIFLGAGLKEDVINITSNLNIKFDKTVVYDINDTSGGFRSYSSTVGSYR